MIAGGLGFGLGVISMGLLLVQMEGQLKSAIVGVHYPNSPAVSLLCYAVLRCIMLCHVVLCHVRTDKGVTRVKQGGVRVSRAKYFKVVRPVTGCTQDKSYDVSVCALLCLFVGGAWVWW